MAADTVLEVSDVSVRFGGLQALDDVGLQVRRGGITGLIGPNGAGKTTLFNVVTGLLEPTAGTVTFDGEDITRWPPHRRGRAGIARTFQRLELFRGLTVYDNLLATWEAGVAGAVLGRNRRQARERVDEVIEQLGLEQCADRQAGQLSTGLGRMVELGRALCANPRILLLDEPGAGLDPGETARFRDVLLGVVGRESGEPAILLVEHDVALVMEVCDEITVLDFGQRIACGTPKEIRNDPAVIAAYLGEGEVGRDMTLLELQDVTVSYSGLRALSGVSLVVPEGCVVSLLGPNGAGKTTTLRTISGLLRPDGGSITFDGRRIHRDKPFRIARAGVLHVPEGRGIFRSITVRANLEMAAYALERGTDVVGEAANVFPALGQRMEQLAGTLSGGEQQMLALARAMLARPRLLMLDEISMGLAPLVVAQLFDAVRRLAEGGTTVLMVEQYVHAALDLSDYVYVLDKGRVVDLGEPADMQETGMLASYLGS